MTRKILHAADIHLDSPLQQLDSYDDAPAARIRSASRLALENLVNLAITEKVDLVVIAGDLYDGDWTDQNTGLCFVQQASRLVKANIPVCVIRGNHDAASRITNSLPLPKNPDGSEILLSEKKTDLRTFESLGIAVHGRSYRQRAETEDLSSDYPKPISGMFNLGLLHTALTGLEGHAPYAPCTPTQLADKGYDYWALGHIHQRGEHHVTGSAPIVFSGNIQGRHVRECGAKGCVMVEIDAQGNCQTLFRPLDVARFEVFSVDVSGFNREDELLDAYSNWLSEQVDAAEDRLLVTRVRLIGPTPMHGTWIRRQSQIESALRAIAIDSGQEQVWLERLRVRTTEPSRAKTNHETNDGSIHSILEVVDQMRHQTNSNELIDKELRDLLTKLPAELTETEDTVLGESPEFLRHWIDDATAELMSRLQSVSDGDAS